MIRGLTAFQPLMRGLIGRRPKMKRPRLTIASLLVAVAIAAIACLAVSSSSVIWLRFLLALDACGIVLAVLAARAKCPRTSTFGTTAAAIGALYLFLAYPVLWNPMARVYRLDEKEDLLPTTAWFYEFGEWLEPQIPLPPGPTPPAAYNAIRERALRVRDRARALHLIALPIIALSGGLVSIVIYSNTTKVGQKSAPS